MENISNRANTAGADSIANNVRRTDNLLARFSHKYTQRKERDEQKSTSAQRCDELDNLRASMDSINSMNLNLSESAEAPAMKIQSCLYRLSASSSIGTCRTSQSPLSRSYETDTHQLELPIDNYFFQKLNESMDEQDRKLSEWGKVMNNSIDLRKNFESNIDINDTQRTSNELIDMQISTLENLSNETAQIAFNDSQTIHKMSKLLTEHQFKLDAAKTTFATKLESSTAHREQYEKELQILTKKLHESRNEESSLNTKLHEINIELGMVNDQVSVTNTMKNKINQNLHKLNDVEKQLIDGINNLKKEMKAQWKEFESKWESWTPDNIATWIVHHGLQLKYEKAALIKNMSDKVKTGKDLMHLSKNDWITIGITNARDRQYLRNEFGILTAPQSVDGAFICPLTKKMMKDPVIAADGYTYGRNAITEWFRNNKRNWNNIECVVSPITGDILTTDLTFSNHTLFKQIQDFKKANSKK